MHHGPNIKGEEYGTRYKTRIGLILFAIYGTLYAGFVVINTVAPALMGAAVFFGLNLAVTYGFGLIVAAIIMGLLYNALCTAEENKERAAETARGSAS